VCRASAAPAAVQRDAPVQSSAYPFTDIEAKWQRVWEEQETFKTPHAVDTSKPKYYVLDMFPYPRRVPKLYIIPAQSYSLLSCEIGSVLTLARTCGCASSVLLQPPQHPGYLPSATSHCQSV
jgi:hypothetical protein